jgi:hypothetical protein
MPEPKDARRLIPDPENELDFYATSSKYPLPDDPGFDMAKPVEEVDELKKRAASEPVAITRDTSEASWFQEQMPPAKRPALQSDASAIMSLVAASAAAPVNKTPFPASAVSSRGSVGALNVSASAMSRLQDATNSVSKASFLNGQNTQALMAMSNSNDIKNLVAVAGAPSNLLQVPWAPSSPGGLSQLQDVINSNNQLLATALRAQLESVQQQPLQHQQQLPEFGANSSGLTTEILAALLRARGL